jgi:hypothetical protein
MNTFQNVLILRYVLDVVYLTAPLVPLKKWRGVTG